MRRMSLPRRPSLLALRLFHPLPASAGTPKVSISGTPEGCLSPDEIVQASLDTDKLSQEQRDHLSICEVCNSKVFVSE